MRNPLPIIAVSALAMGAAVLLLRKTSSTPGRLASPYVFTSGADGQGGDWPTEGIPQGSNEMREAQNVAAFLFMIRTAEGTAREGGYGALFGWPKAGRSFDPEMATGHPKQFFNYTDQAGKTLRTSAAGAYQITFTTWATYYVAFLGWCAANGRSSSGFKPETQDAFCEFLLWRDGALDLVKTGQVDAALQIARGRWASLPGAGYNQPERTRQFVLNAYTDAGGTIA